MLTGRILGAVDALVLQSGEERFGHRIVVADPGAPDGMPEVIFSQRLRELPGCVVAAPVGVKNSILSERMIAGGHLDCLLDERGLVVIAGRPADHFFRMAVYGGLFRRLRRSVGRLRLRWFRRTLPGDGGNRCA